MVTQTYHHGDLKRALLDAGVALLETAGPTGVTAREATREVGVSVTSLYRHFDGVEQWRADVARKAREALARSMLAAQDAVRPSRSAERAARRRFRATGLGYVQFAIDNPTLFAGAFMTCEAAPTAPDDPSAWDVLVGALDELVSTGAMDRRYLDDAPVIAWTAVHGLAGLIVQGALDVSDVGDPRVSAVLDGVARALGVNPTD